MSTPRSLGSGTTLVAERFVVDTGVFLRWWVPQVGYEHAREIRADFLAGRTALVTTDAARYELAHVLRTKALLEGHLDRQGYVAAAGLLDDLDLPRPVDAIALRRVAQLCARHQVRFFDGLFVDLALQENVPLVTADARLQRAVGTLLRVDLLRGIEAG